MQTQNELTPLQLEYIMDEMRGFPDDLGGDYTDLAPEAKESFHVAICGSGVNGLSVALRCQRAGIPYTVLERDDDISGKLEYGFVVHARSESANKSANKTTRPRFRRFIPPP